MEPCDVGGDHEQGRTRRTYGRDESGEKTYVFNSLGYRGEDYDPTAPFKVAVVGCSFTFGTGLELEETWSHKFKVHLAAALGLTAADVNLVNLGAGGTSNDYAARTIFRQVPTVDLDLVVWHLAPLPRTEYVADGVTSTINPGSMDIENLEDQPDHKLGYYDYYNPELGYLSLIKNLLLVQAFLSRRGVDLLVVDGVTYSGKLDKLEHLAPFRAELEAERILTHRHFVHNADRAADRNHAGPKANSALAIDLLAFYGRHLRAAGDERAAAVEAHAEHLQATDPHWAYCTEYSESLRGDLAASHEKATRLVERWPDEPAAREWLDKIETKLREAIGE